MPTPASIAPSLALAAELDRVARAIDEAGIDVVVLKGVPMAERLYGGIADRPMVDNDLLVRPGDAPAVASLLGDLGYQPRPDRSFASELAHGHEFAFFRRLGDGRPLVIDLHWAPWDQHLHPVDLEVLWARTEIHTLRTGASVRVFDAPLTVVHLAAHYAQHRFAEPRNIEDLRRAWDDLGDDEEVAAAISLAHTCGLHHALAYAVAVAGADRPLPHSAGVPMSRRARLLAAAYPVGRRRLHSAADPDHVGLALRVALVPTRAALAGLWAMAFPPIDTVGDLRDRPPSLRRTVRYALRPLRPVGRRLGLSPRWF